MMPPRLGYLCLEAPREGQASYVHVHEIIAGLERRQWSVALYAPSYSGQWQRPPLASRLLQYVWLQVRLALNWWRYDAIYIRAHPSAFPTALMARLTGKPIVHEVNGPLEDLYIVYPGALRWRRVLDGLQRWQFRSAKGLVAVTERLADWLRRESAGANVVVATIPNGANTAIFTPDAPTTQKLPGQFAVFCGGLTQWHGVPAMLAAVKSPDWPAGLPFVIVGDGPEFAEVQRAAQDDPRIMPLGRVAYHDVPGILAKASVGLVAISDPQGRSSISGVAPLKLYEVLACGVPAVVSDLPGMADFVREHDCGLVVAVDDPTALARAVAELVADPERAKTKAQRGAQVVRERHSWDSRAADTAALLDRLCRR